MFDLGWSEIALTTLVAVVVLGPKELPRAMRTAGIWMRRLRLLAGDFQRHVDDMVREAELQELREKAQKLASVDLKQELRNIVDEDGSLARSMGGSPPAAVGAPEAALPANGGEGGEMPAPQVAAGMTEGQGHPVPAADVPPLAGSAPDSSAIMASSTPASPAPASLAPEERVAS